jgi:hypothetical protein
LLLLRRPQSNFPIFDNPEDLIAFLDIDLVSESSGEIDDALAVPFPDRPAVGELNSTAP